ncbi:MAG: DNA mismatch repair protein MutS [Bacteroidetes bacterium]|nr:DNA mismatch repair protein MutS [Bacteroidota bacterium]
MSFIGILFKDSTNHTKAQYAKTPSFFVDLNLDQIVDAITEKWLAYDLKPFFYSPIHDVDGIKYRQEIFHDLENELLYQHVKLFTEQMREVRRLQKLSENLNYKYQKEVWFLYAAETYCRAIKDFATSITSAPLNSRGFNSFSKFLTSYSAGVDFNTIIDEANKLKEDLTKVKYRIIINEGAFTVQHYTEEKDYSEEINETFEKFRQGAVSDYLVKYDSSIESMNHIEAKILEFVAQLHPDLFSRLENFCTIYANLPTGQAGFIDETVADFDREIHFYIAYIEYIEKFKRNNLQFCFPKITSASKEIYNYEGFDLALAQKLTGNNLPIVCNDFYLRSKERIIVVTGPNQGGKTTFARTFGQLHYLANIGCPVPGRQAQLFLFDQIFTQFEKAEKVENLRGKLEDDLKRIHSVFECATSRSIIIMNEIFNSTTLQDVTFLSKKVMERILELDLICVWVTFIDELASFGEQTVSMTSTVIPENPALRTFKIVRRPADGLAYAMAIAEEYRLTYNRIKERIEP